MMLYGYHFSTIENNWEDLTPLNEFLQTFADDDGDVSQRDKESLKEIIAKSLCTRQISQNPYPIRVLPS